MIDPSLLKDPFPAAALVSPSAALMIIDVVGEARRRSGGPYLTPPR